MVAEQLPARRGPVTDRAALRGRGLEPRAQRSLHLRLRSQVEAVPRKGTCQLVLVQARIVTGNLSIAAPKWLDITAPSGWAGR